MISLCGVAVTRGSEVLKWATKMSNVMECWSDTGSHPRFCFFISFPHVQEWTETTSDFCYQAPTLWRRLRQVMSPPPTPSQWDQLRPFRCVSALCFDETHMSFMDHESNSWFTVVKRVQTDSQVCVGLTCTHSTLSLSSPAAAFSLENGAKTKPEREAPQRQEEPLAFQGPLEARPQMRHGQ